MVDMGFPEADSALALAFAGNRLEEACQLLLAAVPLGFLIDRQTAPPGPEEGNNNEDDASEEDEDEESLTHHNDEAAGEEGRV